MYPLLYKIKLHKAIFLLFPVALIIFFKPITAHSAKRSYYSVQLASYKHVNNAEEHVLQLNSKGYDAFYKKVDIPNMGEWHRIFLGKFRDKEDAEELVKKLKTVGFSTDEIISLYDNKT